ncbi:2-polyprenyl-6-methoxyphenol hydroxylase-like FAD-dependent oxidoreductase [Pseudarthrobacter defluvii]|uniref:FAD-dependent monooxygenase n=1 Tax=Pseudarthrobacter defluvii TaxID=410837 RepID=UPI002780F40E|nr:FAD-dependent monooxygenase [Pseudarthrobacter defluvii]MDQ0767850.1 2-polyprenyl-6-methoxyphenol hydroxylase-like FAD-dependent oxidoreductase [Pseudarthrobacter defluvii]
MDGGQGTTADTDLLVVGAGPAGLTTALQAHSHGATVRVVDRREHRVRPSRALMLHARALEGLRPLGVTDMLLDRADTTPEARIHLGRRVVAARLGHADLPDTAFPHLTLVRQADVEEVLWEALQARGVRVDWGVEFRGLHNEDRPAQGPHSGLVHARLHGPNWPGHHVSRFLAGCDGQSSTVRGITGARWRGGPYRVEAVLADLELDGPLDPGLLHVAVGSGGLAFLFALGEGATWRLLATRPAAPGPGASFGQLGPPVPPDEVARLVRESGLDAAVREVRWSAQVALQHRIASTFGTSPVFLAGDAAHAHSPAGGQGMNNGILDALNLGWKLGFASTAGRPLPELLETYGLERLPAARRVLALTHLIFFGEASPHPVARLARGVLPAFAPVLPPLLRQQWLTARGIRLLAQPFVNYRNSAISREGTPRAGKWPRPGQRLPDAAASVDGQLVRLHELTAVPGIHLLLERDAGPLALGAGPAAAAVENRPQLLHVHRLVSHPGRGVVAVRPDGYVGFRCGEADPAQLLDWLRLVGAARD